MSEPVVHLMEKHGYRPACGETLRIGRIRATRNAADVTCTHPACAALPLDALRARARAQLIAACRAYLDVPWDGGDVVTRDMASRLQARLAVGGT